MECKDFELSIIQENKLLSLCKRLRNATLDELLSFMEIEEEVLESILFYLIDNGHLKESNGIYTYIKPEDIEHSNKRKKKNLHLMFQYHSPEVIKLIIKSFCLSIPSQKACYLIDLSDSCILDFYNQFRKLIYERQQKMLLNKFFQKPQQGRYRLFFEKYAYFYVYDNQIFVTDKLLRYRDERIFNKSEIQEFKKVYSYLSRIISHNKNEINLYQNLAEYIWRRNKDFNLLYEDLKINLLNIS